MSPVAAAAPWLAAGPKPRLVSFRRMQTPGRRRRSSSPGNAVLALSTTMTSIAGSAAAASGASDEAHASSSSLHSQETMTTEIDGLLNVLARLSGR